jgi:cytochrome b561
MSATHESRREGGRYSAVSIVLHWTIAAAILTQIVLGWRMTDMDEGLSQFERFQLHKSLGITILLLSLLRLVWRLTHPAPPLPDHMARWEKVFARATHVGFYVGMIGMPLLGWAIVSASPYNIPTLLWDAIPWPHLPVLPGLEEDAKEDIAKQLSEIHSKGAWFILGLLGLHVAGALKHHFLDRDTVLWRMLPIVPRPRS